MSRSHPQQWSVNPSTVSPDPDALAALASLPTTQIADAGGPVGVVGPGIAPVTAETEICGRAVTLWTKPGDILFVLKAPDLIEPGDVLVVDGGGRLDAAIIGDILGGLAQARGAVGLVVDGAVRDVVDLRALGLPTFARGVHPATASKEGPGALNVPIQCGGVVVEPGDVVRADASGVVIIPRESAADVVERTRAVDANERHWRQVIDGGGSLTAELGIDEQIARFSREPEGPPAP